MTFLPHRRPNHPPRSKASDEEEEAAAALRTGASLLLSLLTLGAAIFAYSVRVEPFRLELTRPRLLCPRLPVALEGLRILLLTDPHVEHWGRGERGLLALLDRLPEKPELIVWGGDFLHHPNCIQDALHLCTQVKQRFPDISIFGILGNAEHKMSARRRAAFVGRLEATGMTVLVDQQVALPLRNGAATITVAGVDDPYYGHDHFAAAMAPCPPDRRFMLLLSHSPQLAVRAAKAGVDVMLSGHTHGGQVRLPLLGPLKTQNPLGHRMAAGLFDPKGLKRAIGRDVGGRLVTYISRGIGVAPLWKFRTIKPRLLCRPEVTLLTLHRKEGK